MNSEAIKNRVNNAGTLNFIGMFGILLPIVGIISSGIALRSMNKLLEQLTQSQLTTKLKREIHHRKITAIVAIALSCGAAVVWYIGMTLSISQHTQPYTVTETIITPEQTPAQPSEQPTNCVAQTQNDQLTGNSYTYTTCN